MRADHGRLADEWRRLAEAREHADRLARDYYAHTNGGGVVEVVAGAEPVKERLLASVRSARRELRRLGDPADTGGIPVERQLAARGVSVRALAGSDVPARMYLVDDRFAFVLAGTGTDRALVVHPSQLLKALDLLFEGLWERAGTSQRAAPPDRLRLIQLMLSGLTDEALSRSLGVSPRTAQRRVAALMSAAGARTRFQAGVQTALARRRDHGSISRL
jgi:hypothetical protein